MTEGCILARWQTALENAACSPLEFFGRVENAIMEQEIPNLSFSQITRRQGNLFSPRRIYLRIRHQKLYFDVSAFVVGRSLIVGWWLHETQPGVAELLAELPGFGAFMERIIGPATYYSVDYIEYFQRAVHDSVLRVVDELSEENGFAVLPEADRQPIWEEIW